MTIRLLPDNLVNQIAAGEVVERPASVVKELVENSIDAGATEIEINVREGGSSYISITDNGGGIAKNDLALAVQRHATSKLPDENLFQINTMGFRGEALPSIGAISRLSVSSRQPDSENGWCLRVDGGNHSGLEPVAMPVGTKIEVSDLFFATPARLKFLKTPATECGHIEDILSKIALAHPEISFKFSNERKVIFEYLGADLKARVASILGDDFVNNCSSVMAEQADYKLTGFAGLPTFNRGNATQQYLYVNNRPVKDKILMGAVRVAYQDFLARDRFPVVVLFLQVDPMLVDVNVHPAKTEVRFRDSNLVRSILIGALRSAINNDAHRTSSTISQAVMDSFRPMAINQQLHERPAQAFASFSPKLPNMHHQQAVAYQPIMQQAPEPDPEVDTLHLPLGNPVAQVHGTYIISEADDGLIVVDQHAAHERLVYEKFKNQIAQNGVKRQALLIPEVIDLTEHDLEKLSKMMPALSALGLVVENFGQGSALIREVPAIMGEFNAAQLIRDLLDEIIEFGEAISLRERIFEILASRACHGSIRAGRRLAKEEMSALLREMEKTAHSGQCNHGRPTYVKLDKKQIEKLFGRS